MYVRTEKHAYPGTPDNFFSLHVGVLHIGRIFAGLCAVGYSKNVPGVFTPGITVNTTSVRSVRHSYPYEDFLKFCVSFIPAPVTR